MELGRGSSRSARRPLSGPPRSGRTCEPVMVLTTIPGPRWQPVPNGKDSHLVGSHMPCCAAV
jgi:hypothetical protein